MRAFLDRFNKPKNKYSLEHLRDLFTILQKNPIINEGNKVVIIETLRQIAELLIWGDQHSAGFFDFFLEKNLLGYFLNILDQKTSKQVKVQLIQTLSILVGSIKSQNSLYYLFSNNHINELIIHRFDFSDEEVLAYYVSFLKTLSLKLDKSTIQFFFNEIEQDFPLYTEAIKFFNHEESMIRAAVRTLTLNVFRVEDEAMRKYIINSTAVPYFANIVWFIRQQCHTLDDIVGMSSHDNRRKLDDFVEEMLDHFYYLQDIINLGIDSMNRVLSEHLIQYLFIPIFVGSLVGGASGETERISPVLALYLLAQVFIVFTYKPLITTLAQALIHPNPPAQTTMLVYDNAKNEPPPPLNLTKRTTYSQFRRFSSVPNLAALDRDSTKASSAPPSPSASGFLASLGVSPFSSKPQYQQHNHNASALLTPARPIAPNAKQAPASKSTDNTPSGTPPTPGAGSITPTSLLGNIYRDALLGFFEDDRMALNTLCMLHALIKNNVVDEELLEIGGLYPYRLSKAKQLLKLLTAPSPRSGRLRSTSRGNTNNSGSSRRISNHHRRFAEKTHGRSKSDSSAVIHALKIQNVPLTNSASRIITQEGTTDTPADQNTEEGAKTGEGGLKTSTSLLARSHTTGAITADSTNSDLPSIVVINPTPPTTPQHPIQRSNTSPPPPRLGLTPTTLSPTQSPTPPDTPEAPLAHTEVKMEVHDGGKVSESGSGDSNEESSDKKDGETKPEGEGEENVVLSSSEQNVFTRQLIGRLLNLLVHSNQYRLVTLQMTLLTLRELVYSPDSPPRLTAEQLVTLFEAYAMVCSTLQDRLGGVLGEIFVQLFDTELQSYKQVNFDYLVKDAALLLPVSGTPMSRLDLSRRLPSGEAEKTQKAIQQFLVLRELKYTLLRRKDEFLVAYVHGPQLPILQPKETFVLENPLEYPTLTFMVFSGPNKKKIKRTLVIYKELLVVLDPISQVAKPVPPRPASPPHTTTTSTTTNVTTTTTPTSTTPPASTTTTTTVPTTTLPPTTTTQQQPTTVASTTQTTVDKNTPPPSKHLVLSGTIVHAAPMESLDLQIDHTDSTILNVTSHPTTWRTEMLFDDQRKCEASYQILIKARNDVRAARMDRIYSLLGTNLDDVVKEVLKMAEKEAEAREKVEREEQARFAIEMVEIDETTMGEVETQEDTQFDAEDLEDVSLSDSVEVFKSVETKSESVETKPESVEETKPESVETKSESGETKLESVEETKPETKPESVEETKPVVEEVKPTLEETKPVVEEAVKPVETISDLEEVSLSDSVEVKPTTTLEETKPIVEENPAQHVEEQQTQTNNSSESVAAVEPTPEVKPVVEEVQPVVEDVQPVVEEVKPVVEDVQLVVEEVKPVVDEVEVQERTPVVVEETSTPEKSVEEEKVEEAAVDKHTEESNGVKEAVEVKVEETPLATNGEESHAEELETVATNDDVSKQNEVVEAPKESDTIATDDVITPTVESEAVQTSTENKEGEVVVITEDNGATQHVDEIKVEEEQKPEEPVKVEEVAQADDVKIEDQAAKTEPEVKIEEEPTKPEVPVKEVEEVVQADNGVHEEAPKPEEIKTEPTEKTEETQPQNEEAPIVEGEREEVKVEATNGEADKTEETQPQNGDATTTQTDESNPTVTEEATTTEEPNQNATEEANQNEGGEEEEEEENVASAPQQKQGAKGKGNKKKKNRKRR